VAKINVNKLLLEDWNNFLIANVSKPLSTLMDEGIAMLQVEVERWIEIAGSKDKA
jgi:fructose-bisphosphate aldolase class II